MGVKVTIFGSQGGLPDRFGEIGKFDGSAPLGSVYFIEEFAVAIENFGGGRGRMIFEAQGIRETPENVEVQSDKGTKEQS